MKVLLGLPVDGTRAFEHGRGAADLALAPLSDFEGKQIRRLRARARKGRWPLG